MNSFNFKNAAANTCQAIGFVLKSMLFVMDLHIEMTIIEGVLD